MSFPAQVDAMQVENLTGLREIYGVTQDVWGAVRGTMGDPGEDLRPFAALPPAAIALACENALVEGVALTAIQASQVGLMFRLARRIWHVRDGGFWERWLDTNP